MSLIASLGLDAARIELLSKFLKPCAAAHYNISAEWRAVLGVDPQDVIRDFESKGLLSDVPPDQKLVALFALDELRQFLRDRKIKTSGKKDDLALRLCGGDPEGVSAILNSKKGDIRGCTELGRELALTYIDARKRERTQAIQISMSAFEACDFAGSAGIRCDYELNQVFQGGCGVDWGGVVSEKAMKPC